MTNKHEKMLSVSNYKRNVNQNHNELSLHTYEDVHHRKLENSKCWPGCGENESLVHPWRECEMM